MGTLSIRGLDNGLCEIMKLINRFQHVGISSISIGELLSGFKAVYQD